MKKNVSGFWILVMALAAILVASYVDRKDAEDIAIDDEITRLQIEEMQPPSKPYEKP